MYNLDKIHAELSAAYMAKPWHDTKPDGLLSISNDAKTVKGQKLWAEYYG
jgi:hypothetical protein